MGRTQRLGLRLRAPSDSRLHHDIHRTADHDEMLDVVAA
jgi:hypothetical protein